MNKIIVLFFAFTFMLFAQTDEKKGQNVELPDFVITGTEKISVEKVKKIEPELVTTLSEEFIKPLFSPEELELRKFSNPIKKDINFLDSVKYMKGYFDVSAGFYTIPSGKLFYTIPINGGLFTSGLNGYNQRAYVPESDKFSFGGNAELKLFSGSNSTFLPGSQYNFSGDYTYNGFKLYSSNIPSFKRSIQNIQGIAGYTNFQSEHFQTAFEIKDNYLLLNQNNFFINDSTWKLYYPDMAQNILSFSGHMKLLLQNFNLSAEGKYENLHQSNISLTNSFFYLMPKIGLRLSELFKAEFGFNFTKGLSEIFTSPYAGLALKLDNNLSLFMEYHPHAEVKSSSSFLSENPYLDQRTLTDRFIKYSTDVSFGIKYEYQKYFQINGLFEFRSSSNYPYYSQSKDPRYFTLANTSAKLFNGSIDLLYQLGPYGYLYGRGELSFARDTTISSIPFIPPITANAAYGYNFSKLKLDSEVRITYSSEVYADLPNLTKLPSYIDLGLKFVYQYKPKFFITLEVENILQHNNYKWTGYKEIPFNIAAGIHLIF